MDLTPDNPEGTNNCWAVLSPHATTVPSSLSATLCEVPAATIFTPARPAGTCDWLFSSAPQATTVPSVFTARAWKGPAAMALIPTRLEGMETDLLVKRKVPHW